ncbi:hypothetical protein IGX29_19035 [Streptomyces sp. H28]|uniref:hypothetical protein n=1 Tax=Streptomyces sp. H28 TaxID=2775865 RepID=UPI0017858004|nr:hypothetical protein [Streptomyces sp. H28]MBD9733865.1 hypothetical protein [Streptomyces sp. H28]
MRRTPTTDRSASSALLLLVALLFAQLCVQGHVGLQDGSRQSPPRGPVIGMASAGAQAPEAPDASPATVDENGPSPTGLSPAAGSCPERQAPEQTSGPQLAVPAAAEPSSQGGAPAARATRWPVHSENASAKAPPPHVSVLRI